MIYNVEVITKDSQRQKHQINVRANETISDALLYFEIERNDIELITDITLDKNFKPKVN